MKDFKVKNCGCNQDPCKTYGSEEDQKEEYQKIIESKVTDIQDGKYSKRYRKPVSQEMLKDEAMKALKARGGWQDSYTDDEAKEDYYDWGEGNGYDLYDLTKAWNEVIEGLEAMENQRSRNQPKIPEWETQEWHDEMMEDWENDSLRSLQQAERDFENTLRRDERHGRDDGESRAVLKIIRDLISKKSKLQEMNMRKPSMATLLTGWRKLLKEHVTDEEHEHPHADESDEMEEGSSSSETSSSRTLDEADESDEGSSYSNSSSSRVGDEADEDHCDETIEEMIKRISKDVLS